MATIAPKRHHAVVLPEPLREVERWARSHAPSAFAARRATRTRYRTSPAAQKRRLDAATAREHEWLDA